MEMLLVKILDIGLQWKTIHSEERFLVQEISRKETQTSYMFADLF